MLANQPLGVAGVRGELPPQNAQAAIILERRIATRTSEKQMSTIVGITVPDGNKLTGKTWFMKIFITKNFRGTHSTGKWFNTRQEAMNYIDPYDDLTTYDFIIIEVDNPEQ